MGDPLAAFNIIAMTVGFLFVFFGYRFYKPTLFMGGFAFWAMFTFELCYYISNLAAYGSAAAAGVIGGTLSLWFYPLGVFTLGALWGAIVCFLINGFFFSRISYVICQCNTIFWTMIPIFCVLFGLFTIVVHRHRENDVAWHPRKLVIYSKTAWPGAYMFIRGAAHFSGEFPEESSLATMVSPPTMFYVHLTLICVFALIGTLVQMRYTHYEHCGCDTESDYEGQYEEQQRLQRYQYVDQQEKLDDRQALFSSGTQIRPDQI